MTSNKSVLDILMHHVPKTLKKKTKSSKVEIRFLLNGDGKRKSTFER